uniref:Uncharacterized protein n=1 Tax=Cacopsylla melanoneura TaxID=428564 RepID=A0A8D8QVZ6_9HEMI
MYLPIGNTRVQKYVKQVGIRTPFMSGYYEHTQYSHFTLLNFTTLRTQITDLLSCKSTTLASLLMFYTIFSPDHYSTGHFTPIFFVLFSIQLHAYLHTYILLTETYSFVLKH